MNDSISMEEAILKPRGGGKLQNSHVRGFQPIRLPHQEWMLKGASQRPPYAGFFQSRIKSWFS